VIRANHPATLGPARAKDGATESKAGCCATEGDLASEEEFGSDKALLIFWITNLWRGDRRDRMTLNRAPFFIEHPNSTSANSIVSG
jgi:hypothetical protein